MASIVAQPATTFNIIGANATTPNEDQKILVVAQKVAAGAAPVDTLLPAIDTDDASLATQFGANAIASGMVRAIRALNPVTRIDVYLLDNSTGTAAQGLITFAGTPTNAGSIEVTVGSEIDYTFSLSVATTDTPTTIGDALVTAITANPNVPVSAVNATGAVTITADNPGVLGDQIGLQVDASAVGGITVSPALSPMGATTAGVDALSFTNFQAFFADTGVRYQTVAWPYSNSITNMEIISDLLDAKFNVNNDVLDGRAICARTESTESVFTTATTGLSAGQNSQNMVLFADKTAQELDTAVSKVFSKPAQFELDWIKAAQFSAIRALRFTPGQDISQYVAASSGPLDTIGGPALASKPYANTPMPNLPGVDIVDGWTRTEIANLKASGASILGVNSAGNTALVGEVVTTYKTDAAGNPDDSFKYLNYVDTLSTVREYYVNNNRARFNQSRLTGGDVIGGHTMANQAVIEAYQAQLYQDLSGPGFVLVQAGEQAIEGFKNSIVVSIDLQAGSATIQMTVPIVVQLRVIFGTIQQSFSLGG